MPVSRYDKDMAGFSRVDAESRVSFMARPSPARSLV